ncbi:choice-of-anchor A domain-containing protein [Streptomyces sp. 846.5]|nr:choice-of-anchor A domain-containing protein [Streptomyces sp. 846.5]
MSRRKLRTGGVIAAATALGSLGLTLGGSATAAGTVVNPVRPVDATDVQKDPSHGFGVLVSGDAQLTGGESETSMAVGGTLTFGGYNLASKDAGSATYTAPGDTAPTSLVAGTVDFSGSTGVLQVDQGMYAKIGGSPAVFPSGGTTGIDAPGSTGDGSPHIVVNSSEPAASVLSSSGFDLPSLFTQYRTLNTQMAALTDTVSLQDQNGVTAWNGTDSNVSLTLQPGQNVWNVTAAQLAAIQNINLSGQALGSGAWLVVNVTDSGNIDLKGATNAFQNNPTDVLWNFTTNGTITLDSGRQFSGTLYAPNAAVVDSDGQNLEGDLVARELTHTGAEINDRHFVHGVELIPTATVTPSSSPTPTATASASPTPTPTATTSTPAASATPSASESPSSSPTPSATVPAVSPTPTAATSTAAATPTPSTPAPTPTPTETTSASPTPSATSTPTADTSSPAATPTPTSTPTGAVSASSTPTPSASSSPTPIPTATASSAAATPTPSAPTPTATSPETTSSSPTPSATAPATSPTPTATTATAATSSSAAATPSPSGAVSESSSPGPGSITTPAAGETPGGNTGQLAHTGAGPLVPMALAALGMLTAGALIVLVGRRRKRAH